ANGRTALTAHRGGALHLWDVPGRKHLRQLAGSTRFPQLYLTALAPDGKTVALAPGAAVLDLPVLAAGTIGLLGSPREPRAVLAASALFPERPAVLELWDPDRGRRHQLRTAAPVVGLSFTSDGASLLVADGDGCVTVWDV